MGGVGPIAFNCTCTHTIALTHILDAMLETSFLAPTHTIALTHILDAS